MQSWVGASVDEMWRREPYLLLSVSFLLLRIVLHMLPKVLNHFRTIWASYKPHLNLEIFGETRQILGRILHLIDVERVWTKLKLCKSRNLHRGARNAKVWASSLASVSLGKTSTSEVSSWGGEGRMMHFQKTPVSSWGDSNRWHHLHFCHLWQFLYLFVILKTCVIGESLFL